MMMRDRWAIRVSRSLVTVLGLTFLQVVVGPILSPSLTSSPAQAATFDATNQIVQMDVNLPNTFTYASTRIWDQLRSSDAIETTQLTYTSSGGGYVTFDNGSGSSKYATFSSAINPYLDQTNATTKKNLSVFTWIYPTGDGVIIDEIGNDNGTTNPVWHDSHIEMVGGVLKFRVWNITVVTSTIATPLNNWYYIGYTYDASAQVFKAYVNGQLAGTQTSAVRSVPWEDAGAYGSYFAIGRADTTHMGDGTGGDFRFGSLHIFKAPLTQSVIQNNFEAMAPRFGPTLSAPANASTYTNRTATFSTSACSGTTSGAATCTYQWQLSTDSGATFNNIAGATSLSYTAGPLALSANGYQYRVIAYDPGIGTSTAPDIFQISSAATVTVTAIPGSDTDTALTFNGSNQYAEVSDGTGSAVDITGNVTMEAWVFPTSDCLSDQGVIAKLNSYMLYCGGNGYWKFVFDSDGLAWAGSASTIKVLKNEWHHIAYTKSSASSSALIYIDGQLVQTVATGVTSMSPNNDALQIGRFGSSSYFQGKIDEVRIYNSQRSQAQIAADMNSYGALTDSDLVAYYDFNEGGGSTLYNRDIEGTAATDLTLFNSPSWSDIKLTAIDNAYTVTTFLRSYLTSVGGWRIPTNVAQLSAVVVAGGGGGNGETDGTGWMSGGGGAGGYLYSTNSVTAGSVKSAVVGQGGRKGLAVAVQDSISQQPTSGQNSTFGSQVAIGGGFGGGRSNNNRQNGASGGSGGGGGTYTGSGGSPTSGQGNSGGTAYASCCSAGGGGGAGSAGGTGTYSLGGSAGDGVANPMYLTGVSPQFLAAGGAGGSFYGTSGSVGSKGGTAFNTDAVSNTGSGGGGGGGGNSIYKDGGNGGSGIIIVRWITALKPIFTQPVIDTTTAGISETFSVGSTPVTPLLRNYKWQASTDTGTSWSDLATGSGYLTANYVTPILETVTSGVRYQYRVIVTDSDTAGLFIYDTSTAVYLIINPRIGISGSYTLQKYGTTHVDTFTTVIGTGTGNKSFTFSPNNRSGITWNGSTNQATLTIAATLSPGTYYETMTATDAQGAKTSLGISIVISKADTITVTAQAKSDTYTGSTLNFLPTFTVVGLKNSDTATPMAWSYTGADNAGTSYSPSATKPMNAGTYSITPVPPVTLTDSYTAVVIETATLTINRATRTIAITAPAAPMKYGETRTVSSTPSAGSGDGALTYTTSTTDSCTVSAAIATAIKPSGTCSFTVTIGRGNNYESATSTAGTTSLTKADTLTVQVRNPVTLTYTGLAAASLPTVSIVGLAYTDTATATRLYSAPSSSAGAPESYGALTNSTFVPSDVETYTVSTSLNFTSGAITNYLNVVYETSTLKINQANQSSLHIAMYGAWVGSPFTLVTDGGSGGGAVSESVTAGSSATGCAVTSHVLSMTSTTQSYCNIVVTKAASRNFRVESTTAQIYFMLYVINQPSPNVSSGSGIGLSGATALSLDPNQAPSISSISISSGRVGDSVTITGSGFTASALQSVKFWRNILASIQGTPTNTQIVVLVPSGATSGKIIVTTLNGLAITEGSFSVLP